MHVDIKTNLIEYLFSVTSGYSCKDSQRAKFYDDLKNPENYLLYDDKNTMISYKNREAYKNIRVMTFNYDYIFEMIANYNSSKVVIDSNHEITTVVHIHGTLDEGMIFGVDNEEQFLSNQQLAELWILEQGVKDKLLSYSDLNEEEKAIVKERIFVKINSDFLKIRLEKQG